MSKTKQQKDKKRPHLNKSAIVVSESELLSDAELSQICGGASIGGKNIC